MSIKIPQKFRLKPASHRRFLSKTEIAQWIQNQLRSDILPVGEAVALSLGLRPSSILKASAARVAGARSNRSNTKKAPTTGNPADYEKLLKQAHLHFGAADSVGRISNPHVPLPNGELFFVRVTTFFKWFVAGGGVLPLGLSEWLANPADVASIVQRIRKAIDDEDSYDDLDEFDESPALPIADSPNIFPVEEQDLGKSVNVISAKIIDQAESAVFDEATYKATLQSARRVLVALIIHNFHDGLSEGKWDFIPPKTQKKEHPTMAFKTEYFPPSHDSIKAHLAKAFSDALGIDVLEKNYPHLHKVLLNPKKRLTK